VLGESGIGTHEGETAWREAIKLLEGMKPLQPFKWKNGLAQGCQDHLDTLNNKNGSLAYAGCNFLAKYGDWSGRFSESFSLRAK